MKEVRNTFLIILFILLRTSFSLSADVFEDFSQDDGGFGCPGYYWGFDGNDAETAWIQDGKLITHNTDASYSYYFNAWIDCSEPATYTYYPTSGTSDYFDEFTTSIDTYWLEGRANRYGIYVCMQGNYTNIPSIWFWLWGDSRFAIGKFTGNWIYEELVPWTYNTDIIHSKGQKNILKITKQGNQFTFFINDTRVHRQQIPGYPGGGIGISYANNMKIAFDNFRISQDQSNQHGGPNTTCNRELSFNAQKLLTYLKNIELKKVISGQFIGYASDSSFDLVTELYNSTSKYVAMIGTDYGFSNLKQRKTVNQTLIDYSKTGGLITISWHADNPWEKTFKNPDNFVNTNQVQNKEISQDFVSFVNDLIAGGNTKAASKWREYLGEIADRLEELKGLNIVVLWRPLHEMNGHWFWWGNQDGVAYVKLWRHMFHYLTCERGLNNLLWVYTVNDRVWADNKELDNHEKYYPGPEYVDILGIDMYGTPLSLKSYNKIVNLAGGKPIGLSEFGRGGSKGDETSDGFSNADIIKVIKKEYPQIAYFQVWDDVWAIVNNDDPKSLLTDPNVITLEKLFFKNYMPWMPLLLTAD
jgi:mannan endo-1,4-beta-mannosidase